MSRLSILFATSEMAPWVKTGGLGDVAGALPKALAAMGHRVVALTPLYRALAHGDDPPEATGLSVNVPIDGGFTRARLRRKRVNGNLEVLFLDEPGLFCRPGVYGENNEAYDDNCKRFAFLSRAALETLRVLGEPFDILHLHDWQTALAAAYQRIIYWNDPLVSRPATVLTIHNIFHQGSFWHFDMPMLGLDWSHFGPNELEMNGKINLLKAGIVFADVISAVSPTYASEMQTPEGGFGLDGVLRGRQGRVFGIVNGMDAEEWNPAADPHIRRAYSAADISGKAECKRALQEECKLPVGDAPLVAVISRLDKQKGLDILAAAFPDLMARGVQFVLLGTGEWWCHYHFPDLQSRWPAQTSVHLRFDNALAHRIQAGADMILMPSLFEPCGLVQLAALRYGTVPIARRTGGLSDTIVDASPDKLAAGSATGFLFNDYLSDALLWAVDRALTAYRDKTAWRRIQAAGMNADWSWRSSALQYVDLFQQAAALRAQR